MKTKLILSNILIAGITVLTTNIHAAPNPASQDWVKTWVSANFTSQDWVKAWASANFTPITPAINWSSLCSSGQSLTDSTGCSPNCNSGSAASTCNTIFNKGQVEQLSGIALPFLIMVL